jgi:hypothetical protein
VQPFWLGQSDEYYYQLDIQSCYGSVMHDGWYPVRVVAASESGFEQATPPPAEHLIQVIGTVDIEIEQPVVPIRTDKGNIYPVGQLTVTLAGPELELVQRHGRILRWHDWVVYELRPIFEDYVDHFWEMRVKAKNAGDAATELFCKLMLNSLYGKFGQHGVRWELLRDYHPLREIGIWYECVEGQLGERKLLSLGKQTYAELHVDPPHHVCPAIAAYVTSYARDLLWRYIEAAGLEHVYYVATDSLIVDETGYENLVVRDCVKPGELGALKVVTEGRGLWINSIHWYGLGEKKVVGGVSARAEEVEEGRWRETHFETLRQILARGGGSYVRIGWREKMKYKGYYGGILNGDGRIMPYRLPRDKDRMESATRGAGT